MGYHFFSFPIGQCLVIVVKMTLIYFVLAVARIHRCAETEGKIKTLLLGLEWSLEIQISQKALLTGIWVYSVD